MIGDSGWGNKVFCRLDIRKLLGHKELDWLSSICKYARIPWEIASDLRWKYFAHPSLSSDVVFIDPQVVLDLDDLIDQRRENDSDEGDQSARAVMVRN